MKHIITTDLWTEQYANHQDITSGAFVDGVQKGVLPYDAYKIVLNCNCVITSNSKKVIVGNKHQAIVFYSKGKVVRLVVFEKDTDILQSVQKALSQKVDNVPLSELLTRCKVKKEVIDLEEQPILTKSNDKEQMDAGSCDRLPLLKSMLEGGYTESETEYGNSDRSEFQYFTDICVNYHLVIDKEIFDISHKGVLINRSKTRVIPIQTSGSITDQELEDMLISYRII